MEIPRLGVDQSYSRQSTPQLQQRQIWAVSATYTTAHGHAGSLTHWARPGIEPTISWFLVGFISAAPRRELHNFYIPIIICVMRWSRRLIWRYMYYNIFHLQRKRNKKLVWGAEYNGLVKLCSVQTTPELPFQPPSANISRLGWTWLHF